MGAVAQWQSTWHGKPKALGSTLFQYSMSCSWVIMLSNIKFLPATFGALLALGSEEPQLHVHISANKLGR